MLSYDTGGNENIKTLGLIQGPLYLPVCPSLQSSYSNKLSVSEKDHEGSEDDEFGDSSISKIIAVCGLNDWDCIFSRYPHSLVYLYQHYSHGSHHCYHQQM